MPEPITTASAAVAVAPVETTVAGVKLALLVAGFAGAVVSLSYVKELTRPQMFGALVSGAFCAAYLTPITVHYLGVPTQFEYGAGFLVGLGSMNIVPGLLKLFERFRSKPEAFIRVPGNTTGGEK